MFPSPEQSVLLIIDMQQRLIPAIAESEAVTANAKRLAGIARLLGVPVLATEQNPKGLGPNLAELRVLIDDTLEKQFFDATRETRWAKFLPKNRPEVFVTGCEAHVCVMQTVLGMRCTDTTVHLVSDAIGSRSLTNRAAAIARAAHAGANIVTTEMVIFEWLATAEHPRFREALSLLK